MSQHVCKFEPVPEEWTGWNCTTSGCSAPASVMCQPMNCSEGRCASHAHVEPPAAPTYIPADLPPPVTVATPDPWPEVTVGSRWEEFVDGVSSGRVLTVSREPGAEWVPCDIGIFGRIFFARGGAMGWGDVGKRYEYRPHVPAPRKEAPAAPPLREVAAPLRQLCGANANDGCQEARGFGRGFLFCHRHALDDERGIAERMARADAAVPLELRKGPQSYAIRPVTAGAVQSHALTAGGVFNLRGGR